MIAKERLYRWLNNATFVEEKGCSHPLDVLAVAIGCTERTVIRAVKELEAEGRIRVKRPKVRGRANTYWVDCWNPSKRCPVLAVLAGGRAEVGRRRTLKHQAELSRVARRASCHPNENSRPSRAQTPGVNPFLTAAVENQRCGREARANRNGLSRRTWMQEARFHRQRHLTVPDLTCPKCQELAQELEAKAHIVKTLQLELNKAMSDLAGMTEAARATGKANEALRGQLTRQGKESAKLEQIEAVVAHWRTHRPKASKAFGKPGSKSFKTIEAALILMADDDAGAVGACCEAIDGLHLAPYQEFEKRYRFDGPGRTLRNDVEHALGDESRIERCRSIARRVRNLSLDARHRAYLTSLEVHEAYARALLGELWTPPAEPDDSIEVDGLIVRP